MGPPPFLSEERMKKSKALSLAVTVLTVLVCAALCASVLTLYASGMRSRAEAGSALVPIFTREAAARQLMKISPLLALWLIAVIAARVCHAERAWKKNGLPRTSDRVSVKSMPETAKKSVLRSALYAAAALFIVLGTFNGGLHDVLVKAINICTECIGLG